MAIAAQMIDPKGKVQDPEQLLVSRNSTIRLFYDTAAQLILLPNDAGIAWRSLSVVKI